MKKYGLSKAILLRDNREFEQVYTRGIRAHGEGFTLIYCRNGLGFNRLGISVHRRLRGAVKRNRIKRIIRESFRLDRQQYPLDADIVFAVKPTFSVNSPEAITRAVSPLAFRNGTKDE